MIARGAITGLVLCGGRGSRMGGLDKGLQVFQGQPLAARALERLRPQVGPLMISANRNTDAYGVWGVPVVVDPLPGHPGPLAGLLAGLQRCETEWLACVPCDAPWFPLDLVARLAEAASTAGTACAVAVSLPQQQMQPVFALAHRRLRDDLHAALLRGELKAGLWWRKVGAARAGFGETAEAGPAVAVCANADPRPGIISAFANLNTLDDLRG